MESITKKLLIINVVLNWGSTGRIAEQIGERAMANGWDCYYAYARNHNNSKLKTIKIGSKISVYEHYFENVFFDNEGLASRYATRNFVKIIREIKPDIVHLHNIHDHYLNYPILFNYLKEANIPIVWTQHDCWSFTGGCCYYSLIGCQKWKNECESCVLRPYFRDRSKWQFNHKKNIFTGIRNLTLVPVSEWLSKEVYSSFFMNSNVITILNGVDVNVFKPTKSNINIRDKYNFGGGHILLGIASIWSKRKGLNDYIKLSTILKPTERIVLVGLSEKQSRRLPSSIISIPRTQNLNELVALYNEASIVLNLSYEETFGMTTVEGFACGTPSIVYNCTASPELITENTGRIVKSGDIEAVYSSIIDLLEIGKKRMTDECRKRALEKYDKNKCFEKYVDLYEMLMNRTKLS